MPDMSAGNGPDRARERRGVSRLEGILRTEGAGVVTVWARARDVFERTVKRRGYERETAVLILKSAVAATLAMSVGLPLDPDGSFVGFAPFSALLVVQPSVYSSVLQSGRYVVAVVIGALLAGAGGLTVGVEIWAFAIVVLVALVLGQFNFFGQQGRQVPVVAAFALAGGSAGSAWDLGQLLLMVGVGALSALTTNFALAPAIRFKDAENAVLNYADSMRYIVTGLTEELRGEPDGSRLGRWARVAETLDGTARNAWSTVESQEYRVRLNPRRLLIPTRTPRHLNGYRTWIAALERASRNLQSITKGFENLYGGHSDHIDLSEDFQREYAALLDEVAKTLQTIQDEEEPERDTVSDRLADCLDDALGLLRHSRRRLMHEPGEEEPVRAALLTDITRFLDELNRAREYSGGSA